MNTALHALLASLSDTLRLAVEAAGAAHHQQLSDHKLDRIIAMSDALTAKVDALTAEVARLRSAEGDMAARVATRDKALVDELTALKGSAQALPADTTAVEARIDALVQQVQATRADIEGIDPPGGAAPVAPAGPDAAAPAPTSPAGG